MRTVTTFLFYLLLLLLPTQLGRHFFFDFSLVAGVRSDYLAPTVYLTDIVIGLMITTFIAEKIKNTAKNAKIKNNNYSYLLYVLCYLLFTTIFITINKWVAFYKLVKIIEFALLGFIIYRLKPKLSAILTVLAVDVIYTALIAIWQFVLQRSIGGVFWFLGERTFYAGTPGIAAASLGGRLLLRPYATFSHPNVLAGFLAVVLPLLLFILLYRRSSIHKIILGLFLTSFLLGLLGLILSFSRAAWGVALIGFLLIGIGKGEGITLLTKKHKSFSPVGFYGLIILSIIIPFTLSTNILTKNWRSWNERTEMIKSAIDILSTKPVVGVGLNNFITHSYAYIRSASTLYIFQPVHNVYLLILAETGIIGFFFFLLFLGIIYYCSLKADAIITIALIQLFFLGFFDHYLFTLQQGQLLFTVFASLAIGKCYNKN